MTTPTRYPIGIGIGAVLGSMAITSGGWIIATGGWTWALTPVTLFVAMAAGVGLARDVPRRVRGRSGRPIEEEETP